MKLTISDASFHNKIMSRYRKGKGSGFMFPFMFFLRSARFCLARMIDIHVRLNLQIHNKTMNLFSVMQQKFHDMKVIFSWLRQEKHTQRGVLYPLNNTLTLSRIHELISGVHEINNISVNGTTAILRTPIFSIVNYHSKKLALFRKEKTDTFTRKMTDHVLNYSITSNNRIILQRTVYSQIFNHSQIKTNSFFSSDSAVNNIFSNYTQTLSNTTISSRTLSVRPFYHPPMVSTNNYYTQTKPVNYWDSNYMQIRNNIFSYPRLLNDVNSLNYLRTANNNILQRTVYSQMFDHPQTTINNYSTQTKPVNYWDSNYTQIRNNIFSYPRLLNGGNNLTLRCIGKNFKFITKTTALFHHIKDHHKGIVFSPARSIHFGFATHLKPEVHNGINGSNNNTASADIVFKKPHSENKITGENKLIDEKAFSAIIRADKQIKNVSPQLLQGEISLIANKVYKLLERRLSIEKEKRGVHIIG